MGRSSSSRGGELVLDDLADAAKRQRLKWAMSEPERLRPGQTRQALTESVAETFASLAQALRDRGHDSHEVAKFLNRLVFCMFAEDVDLLPRNLFTRMLDAARRVPSEFVPMARELFGTMASGGRFGVETVAHFNGKGGPFDVPGDRARTWLRLPTNPNGRINADVLKPWMNGMDLTRRPAGKWIVDFGWSMSAADAALYEKPFRWVQEHVHPMRQRNRRRAYRENWWRHVEPRQGMWAALDGLSRYIATARVAKHRLFGWFDARICPDSQLIVIARDDDTTFGILHSRFHENWSLRRGTWLGKGNDPRYTPTTTFETFPFPPGLEPDVPTTDYEADPRAQAVLGHDAARGGDEQFLNCLARQKVVRRLRRGRSVARAQPRMRGRRALTRDRCGRFQYLPPNRVLPRDRTARRGVHGNSRLRPKNAP